MCIRDSNLTMQQMKILYYLKMNEGKKESSQKDIQDFMRISHPTVVNILRLMKEKGFIEISTSQEDKRMRKMCIRDRDYHLHPDRTLAIRRPM